MGTAGMGDCLAGTVLSLIGLANKDDKISAVLFATGIHSLAADIIKEESGDIGLLASQVIMKISKLLNEKENRSFYPHRCTQLWCFLSDVCLTAISQGALWR